MHNTVLGVNYEMQCQSPQREELTLTVTEQHCSRWVGGSIGLDG